MLFRSGLEVVVARDLCPHRGMLLSRGWTADGQIICPYHGLHFDGTGRCTAIPSQPDAVIPERLALTLVASIERYGLIWASFASETPALPRFEAWDDPSFQQIVCPTIDIAGAAGRQVEGFLGRGPFRLGAHHDVRRPQQSHCPRVHGAEN